MTTIDLKGGGSQLQIFQEEQCSPSLVDGLEQKSVSFLAVHILLSVTAFLGNFLILVALQKESSLHPPSKLLYRSLAITDLLVGLVSEPLYVTYWIFLVQENWSLCQYASNAAYIATYALCGVSLMTMTAISVDRLLALLLGPRYRKIVTLKRTYIIIATIWVMSTVAATCFKLDHRITHWSVHISIPFCLGITIISYIKIFRTLNRNQAQVEGRFHQQPGQLNALNITRYKKAVYIALSVQLALVICYAPYSMMVVVIADSKTHSSHLVLICKLAVVLVYFNSTLNPFLYCWKISEVGQAVK